MRMRNEQILSLSALELAEKIRNQEVKSEQAVMAVLEKIDARECELHSYVSLWKEEARKQARACDEFVRNRTSDTVIRPLLGVPVAVKDNLVTAGRTTSCGSKMLDGYVPPYTATAVAKLQEAGAIILGKTNMDEFGMGVSTETSYFGPTKNPIDSTRVPGGSSGGSAAAVASGEAFAALGTDTGGSVRQPAAFCGLVGLRPTYGSVSRHGLVAFASSMDTVGPITRATRDAAKLFNIVNGADSHDQTSFSGTKIDLSEMERYALSGKRIGVPRQLLQGTEEGEFLMPEVRAGLEHARAFFTAHGATVEEVDLPILDYAVAIYYILSSAEASSNLSRYDGVRYGYRASDVSDVGSLYTKTRSEGFGLEVKRRILLGNYVLSSEHFEDCYRKAERARMLLTQALEKTFQNYDFLLCPTSPMVAPKIGESGQDPLQAYISDLCTVPASLAGIPAISIPASWFAHEDTADESTDETTKDLPAGIQLMSRKCGEQEILGAARYVEKEHLAQVLLPDKEVKA